MDKKIMIWLEEKRREILSSSYSEYKEGYVQAVMDMQNKIKSTNIPKDSNGEHPE